jgi:hypothetical protein
MKYILFQVLCVGLLATSCSSEVTPEITEPDVPVVDTSSTRAEPASLGFSDFRTGDIIFHESAEAAGRDVTLATGSKYNHVGLIFVRPDKDVMVIAAGTKVQSVPLAKWLEMGNNKYVLKRLNNSDELFSTRNLKWMSIKLADHRNKNYDAQFNWDNEEFYAAELVWKLIKDGTGVELGALQTLGDFDLSSPEVSAQMAAKYGEDIPLDMEAISPQTIFDSEELFLVHEN